MAKASNNEFPSVLFTDGTADPSAPSASTVRLYFKNDTPYWINSGGTAVAVNATDLSASNLSDLSDVGTATPTDGQVLTYATATSTWEPAAAGGGSSAFSGAKATRSSTAQTVSNSSVTAVSFDTEEYDEGAYWAIGTPTRFEVPAVGYYLITGGIYFALNSTGVRTIYVRKNGTDIIAANQIENVNGAVDFMNIVTTDYASSATDYYEILCFQSSGGNLDLVANDRNFGSVTQLGT